MIIIFYIILNKNQVRGGFFMLKFTKITASIGPKSSNHAILTKMVRAGVNLVRINFSHDTGDVQGARFELLRVN